MQFVYPWVLWFSFLAIIPIIIHLFYFRRYKTVYFSNTDLLENVIKQSRSQQKLRNLIILLLRILSILLLVLAFSQPYLKKDSHTANTISNLYAIYIDNTFSMNDEGSQNISLLEEVKSKAIAFVQSLPINTKFLLYYHGQQFSTDKLLSHEDIQKKISEISLYHATAKWSNVFSAIQQAATNFQSENISYAWFTDGQRYSVDHQAWKKDSADFFLFHTVASSKSNLSIDSIWFETPHHLIKQKEKLWAKITNHGENDFNALPIKLYLNDTLKSTNTLNLAARSSEKIAFDFTNIRQGWHNGKVELSDFPITFDNQLYFSYYVYPSIPVAIVDHDLPNYFSSFFKSDSLFKPQFISWNAANKQKLSNQQVIVLNRVNSLSSGLWAQLLSLLKNGTTLIISPSKTLNIAEMNELLNSIGIRFTLRDTARLNISISSYDQEFFKGMFIRKEERVNMPWIKTKFNLQS